MASRSRTPAPSDPDRPEGVAERRMRGFPSGLIRKQIETERTIELDPEILNGTR